MVFAAARIRGRLRTGQAFFKKTSEVPKSSWIGHEQDLQQHRVHEAEDRRVGLDTKSVGEHGDSGEPRFLQQPATGEFEGA